MKARRILLIGGNRFVGLRLAWRLVGSGEEVTLLNRGNLPDPFGDRVRRLRGDRRTDLGRLLGGLSFDAAVDFAAFRGEDARAVVEVLGDRLGHYVFVSSGQVYLVREGLDAGRPGSPRAAREEDYEGPLLPEPAGGVDREEWAYGVGKRECEDVLLEAGERSGFPATRLRVPMIDGERDYRRRLEAYLWRLLDGRPVLLPDGGTLPVRHIYAGELARTIHEILGRPATFGRAFNLAQDETPTLRELLTLLASLLGLRPRFVAAPRERLEAAGLDPVAVSPFSTPWMSLLDPARARAEIGFHHEPLDTYLGHVIASFLAHPPEGPPPGYSGRAGEVALAAAGPAEEA